MMPARVLKRNFEFLEDRLLSRQLFSLKLNLTFDYQLLK